MRPSTPSMITFDYDDRITKDEVLEIIGLYLFPAGCYTHTNPHGHADARAHARLSQLCPVSMGPGSDRSIYGVGIRVWAAGIRILARCPRTFP